MMYRVSVIICVVACTLLIFAGAGPDAAVAADSNNSSKQNNAGSDSKENQSLKIEYTPFYPDRMYVSASHEQNKLEKKWGQRWQWPLKTFPNDYRMDWMSDLGDSYGLVYVPGETVQLRIEGDSPQGRVDRIKATNVLDDSTLPVKRGTVSQELAAINAKKSDYIFQDKALKKRGIACDIYKTRGGGAQQGKRVGEKIVNKISFDPAPRDNNVALRFTWYTRISRKGEYTFRLASDDGAHLLINDRQVLDNGGNHGMDGVKKSVTLAPGVYKFEVRCWQGGGGKGVEFAWNVPAPGSAWRQWEIPIPQSNEEKHLEVYRVKAFRDGEPVASRGLIVAKPWSKMTVGNDPNGVMTSSRTLHEWSGGKANPYARMNFFFGKHQPFKNDMFPMRNRPWGDTGEMGLAEFYSWAEPRSKNWKKYNEGTYIKDDDDKERAFTSSGYKDRTLEWNPWWHYYARGVSKWEGGWQWGPFAQMSIENHVPKDYAYDVCYSDIKKYSSAYPNGMLFWQWHWNGLLRYMKHYTKYGNRDGSPSPAALRCSDGWAANSLPGAIGRWINYQQEVGMMRLYHRRRQQLDKTNAWTNKYSSFGEFMKTMERNTLKQDNKANDFTMMFGRKDLDTKGFALLTRASVEAYENVTGKEATFFARNFSALDFDVSGSLFKNFRPLNDAFFSNLITWMDTAGDYGHQTRPNGNDYFEDLRHYRGFGLVGALTGALFPETRYGFGYNVVNWNEDPQDLNNGANMPGNKAWAERTIKYRYDNHHAEKFQNRVKFMDDGQSFRRFDLSERIPMYLDDNGQFRGRAIADQAGWGPSRIEKWNTQVFLGMQTAEIPDRKRPLGGVMVLDSNNPGPRENGNQFLTDKDYVGYVTAIMDELGIWAFTNPTMLDKLPEDMPRIYAPRKLNGESVLMAKVNGKTVGVPYTGQEMHKPSHSGFQKFVRKVRNAYEGKWPVRTTGGFVATAWQSSNGDYFVYVENPMAPKNEAPLDEPPKQYDDKPLLKKLIKERPGRAHPHRKGTIRVRLQEPMNNPVVVDLNGDNPDPHRLADDKVNAEGDVVSFDLEWDRGDGRLFWIPAATAQESRQARTQ